jgi:hypothetical protein
MSAMDYSNCDMVSFQVDQIADIFVARREVAMRPRNGHADQLNEAAGILGCLAPK